MSTRVRQIFRHGSRSDEPHWRWALTAAIGLSGLLAAPLVFVFLASESAAVLSSTAARSLVSVSWRPTEGLFGLLPLVTGTLATSAVALLVAAPLGIGAALYVEYYARKRHRALIETTLGILAGTPSVVYGLVATVWLVPRLGPTLAAGALVLAAMVTPTVSVLSLAALRQLPRGLVEAGVLGGLSREQVLVHLALRAAGRGLAVALSLALARCLGEALAVEMVCGNVAQIPTGLLEPVKTLTTTLVQELDYARHAHRQALHLVALAVVVLAGLLSALALRLERK